MQRDMQPLWRIGAGTSLLLCSTPAFASDYSGLAVILYGGVSIAFAIVFLVAWVMTRDMQQRWLRVLILSTIAALFWAPIRLGVTWWPVSCFFLNAEDATEAPFSIIGTTVLLWVFVMCLPRKEVTSIDPP